MQFFWSKKSNIDSIEIPNFDWYQEAGTNSLKQWVNSEETMVLSINFFELEPDIPTIKEVTKLRQFYRELVFQVNGGIIELEIISIKEILCVKAIFKIPQKPHGMSYVGSFTFPFKDYSYVVKLQAPEYGATGLRDAMILSKLRLENLISIENGTLKGWFCDPYDSSIQEGIPMNKSEEPIYDHLFLEHPLTQLRKKMLEIETKIDFKSEIFKLKKFEK